MQGELFSTCWQCGETHPDVSTVPWTVFHDGNRTSTYYFCGESCRQHFAQERMRRLEGDYDAA